MSSIIVSISAVWPIQGPYNKDLLQHVPLPHRQCDLHEWGSTDRIFRPSWRKESVHAGKLSLALFVSYCAVIFVVKMIWVRSRNRGCLVAWFCYQLIVKPGNKTATVSWPDRTHIALFWINLDHDTAKTLSSIVAIVLLLFLLLLLLLLLPHHHHHRRRRRRHHHHHHHHRCPLLPRQYHHQWIAVSLLYGYFSPKFSRHSPQQLIASSGHKYRRLWLCRINS